jgi:ubiquinone/menaquinone biosynthesis C-methylase UbiE
MQEIPYVGNELELFQHATTWKNYFGKFLQPYLKGKVLEVGAGIGGTTLHLCDGTQNKWTCLEPDPQLFSELKRKVDAKELPACCEAVKGVIKDLPPSEKFNTIMYIDVIEHIENDGAELLSAYNYLEEGGYLIVLVPAHQYVFSPFDKSIGHFRRYNKKMLRNVAPNGMQVKKMWYLDCMGLMASVVNKLFLKQSYPTLKQISMWDKTLVPISKVADVLINYRTGKTLVAVWQKNHTQK